jgi:hypothetical protein
MTASITCSKNETICTDCVDMMLKEYNMVRYQGQENWCSSLSLFEYENKQYFVYDNCLADMYFIPIDCILNQFCITNGLYDRKKCELFYNESKNLGIVGINP